MYKIIVWVCFQNVDTLVTGQSQEIIRVSDNVAGHKNKESSNDGEPTEKYSSETAEKYFSATLPATGPSSVSVSPGVSHNNSSLEVRTVQGDV